MCKVVLLPLLLGLYVLYMYLVPMTLSCLSFLSSFYSPWTAEDSCYQLWVQSGMGPSQQS